MKIILLLILNISLINSLYGLEPGGFISPKYFPAETSDSIKIPIYHVIGGEIIGYCTAIPNTNPEGFYGFFINDLYGRQFPAFHYPLGPLKIENYYSKKFLKTNSIDSCEYYANGYLLSGLYLVYYEKKGNYLKILANTIEGGAWIKMDEKYFTTTDWVNEIIPNCSGPFLWGYENYRLRSQPSLDGEIILKLSESTHKVIEFHQRKGNWIEITVCELKPGIEIICEDVKVVEQCLDTYTGWIRVVDENGMPEDIWFDTGC